MFKCTCKYHTCKKQYKTELARNRHLAGVFAQKTKQLLSQSDVEKPTISKIKSGGDYSNWSEVAKRAGRTRKRNRISKKLFGREYKELRTDQQQKVDAELPNQIIPKPITHDEIKSSKGPQKAYMSGKLAVEATKLRILQIDRKKDAPNSQFVEFRGEGDGESNGVIDLLSIKKNRDEKLNKKHGLDQGDLLDIIHIQVKGGGSNLPTSNDKRRMQIVSKFYHCRETLLSEWNPAKFSEVRFSRLNSQNEWKRIDENTIFGK